MIPTVTCQRTAKGKRKRHVEYREVRLCAARCKGSATAHYEAGLRGVNETGKLLGQAAREPVAGAWTATCTAWATEPNGSAPNSRASSEGKAVT